MAKTTRVLLVFVAVCLVEHGTVEGASRSQWPRVVIGDPVALAAIHLALDGAVQWFSQTRCQGVLRHFRDEAGCPLADKLATLGTSFDRYLQWIVIRDGEDRQSCANPDVFAVTAPGNRVVLVCTRSFAKTARTDPLLARAIIIHEVLHTLGLGENGRHPTSTAITRRVLTQCAR